MATRSGGRVHRTLAITLALVSTLAIAAPALAKAGNAGGNSAASAACEDGGFANWRDAAGSAFRNAGACVSYAAHGGTLVPVLVNPFSISYVASGTNAFRATLTGTGLEPDSTVDLFVSWGDTTTFVGDAADASGDVTFVASVICVSAGSPVTAVSAGGTPAGGTPAEYPLPLPDATVCPPA
jgi:hypothetical protein